MPGLSASPSLIINEGPAPSDSVRTVARDYGDILEVPSEYKQVQVGASLTATAKQFPSFLAGAIRRIPKPDDNNILVAAISITFPVERFKGQCHMSLEILYNKIESLASLLFCNIHLETTAGLRYVSAWCFQGASKSAFHPPWMSS